MQQINEKIIKINSKKVEKSLLKQLLYGKTIYFTNDFEARFLAKKHCNLTVMKLDSSFLGLNLINSNVYKEDGIHNDQYLRNNKDKLINYRSNNLRDNQHSKKQIDELKNAYEFESSNFVQLFGLTFRMQSPYYHLFVQKIITFKENNLIANLLHKWSNSRSACDSIRNSNLYSNDLDLHNNELNDNLQMHSMDNSMDESELNFEEYSSKYSSQDKSSDNSKQSSKDHYKDNSEHNFIDNSKINSKVSSIENLMQVDTNWPKYKKIENNVQTNHFRAITKSDQINYAKNIKLNTLTNWLSKLFKKFKKLLSNSSMNPGLNRIFYLFALGLSLTCLLVLVELFIAVLTNKEIDKNLDKNNRQTNNKHLLKNGQQESTKIVDKLSSLNDHLEEEVNDDPFVVDIVSNLTTENNCATVYSNKQSNRSLIAAIATTDLIEQSSALFNGDHFHNCNDNLFTSTNCPEHYSFVATTAFDNCQVSFHEI